MSFAVYSFALWFIGTSLRAGLFLLCWRQGIHRLLPKFQLFLAWEIASSLGSYPAIALFGQGSDAYIFYYYLTGAFRSILQALALLEIGRLARVRIGSWVWAGALALGSLVVAGLSVGAAGVGVQVSAGVGGEFGATTKDTKAE